MLLCAKVFENVCGRLKYPLHTLAQTLSQGSIFWLGKIFLFVVSSHSIDRIPLMHSTYQNCCFILLGLLFNCVSLLECTHHQRLLQCLFSPFYPQAWYSAWSTVGAGWIFFCECAYQKALHPTPFYLLGKLLVILLKGPQMLFSWVLLSHVPKALNMHFFCGTNHFLL